MKRKGKIKYLALCLAILVVLLAVAWQAQAQPVLNPANGVVKPFQTFAIF